jgi:acyl carrier protein
MQYRQTVDQTASGGQGDERRVQIEGWLQSKIAELLGVREQEIDVTEPLSTMGLDSVMALCVTGELELFLEREIPEEVMTPQTSIRELSRKIVPGGDHV